MDATDNITSNELIQNLSWCFKVFSLNNLLIKPITFTSLHTLLFSTYNYKSLHFTKHSRKKDAGIIFPASFFSSNYFHGKVPKGTVMPLCHRGSIFFYRLEISLWSTLLCHIGSSFLYVWLNPYN